jgi:hypothetical protein
VWQKSRDTGLVSFSTARVAEICTCTHVFG